LDQKTGHVYDASKACKGEIAYGARGEKRGMEAFEEDCGEARLPRNWEDRACCGGHRRGKASRRT